MTERVLITRDPGTADDVWNETTGSYEPDTTAATVYDGKAYIASAGWAPQVILEGGAPETHTTYKLSIPIDSPEIKPDDIVTCLVSDRHPLLVEQEFIVRDNILTSFAVSQRIGMDRYEPQRPR